MIITCSESSDSTAIGEEKLQLFCGFEMKDLGPLRYFLGIEVAIASQGSLRVLSYHKLNMQMKCSIVLISLMIRFLILLLVILRHITSLLVACLSYCDSS